MVSPEFAETLEKLKSFCAYRERCESEVLNKLKGGYLSQQEIKNLIAELKKLKFLDDARFATAFAGGKFRIKGWGKQKIKAGLKAKQLPKALIEQALDELDPETYQLRLNELAQKKWRLLGQKKDRNTRQKLFRFLYGKGYETELINQSLTDLFLA